MIGRVLDWIGEPVRVPRFSLICFLIVSVAWIFRLGPW
jgi:hypothetical protein